eukprot:240720-Rhodomonas_salina.2
MDIRSRSPSGSHGTVGSKANLSATDSAEGGFLDEVGKFETTNSRPVWTDMAMSPCRQYLPTSMLALFDSQDDPPASKWSALSAQAGDVEEEAPRRTTQRGHASSPQQHHDLHRSHTSRSLFAADTALTEPSISISRANSVSADERRGEQCLKERHSAPCGVEEREGCEERRRGGGREGRRGLEEERDTGGSDVQLQRKR